METFQKFLEELTNPLILGILSVSVLIFWPLRRFLKIAGQQQKREFLHGWSNDAQTKTAGHETGIGTKEVRVMRPPVRLGIPLMALFSFGGAAYYMAFHPASFAGGEAKRWLVVLGSGLFAVAAFGMIITLFSRVEFDADTGTKRALLLPRKSGKFSELDKIDPFGPVYIAPVAPPYATGLHLTFLDGTRISIHARFSGYRQFLEHLGKFDAKFKLMARMHANAGGSS